MNFFVFLVGLKHEQDDGNEELLFLLILCTNINNKIISKINIYSTKLYIRCPIPISFGHIRVNLLRICQLYFLGPCFQISYSAIINFKYDTRYPAIFYIIDAIIFVDFMNLCCYIIMSKFSYKFINFMIS